MRTNPFPASILVDEGAKREIGTLVLHVPSLKDCRELLRSTLALQRHLEAEQQEAGYYVHARPLRGIRSLRKQLLRLRRRALGPPKPSIATSVRDRDEFDRSKARDFRRDCTVTALAAATGRPTECAYRALREAGREDNRGATRSVILKAAKILEDREDLKWDYLYSTLPTVARWVKQNPTGRHLVITRNHAVAVVDGVLIDNTHRPKTRARVECTLEIPARP